MVHELQIMGTWWGIRQEYEVKGYFEDQLHSVTGIARRPSL